MMMNMRESFEKKLNCLLVCLVGWFYFLQIYSWDNIITFFPFSLSSKPFLLPLSTILKLLVSFYTNCYYMHICNVYTLRFLNIACLVYRMFLVCMFSGMTVWHGKTDRCAPPWRRWRWFLPLVSFFNCWQFFA